MADHLVPDYELEETRTVDTAAELKALFDETRIRIADLLLERAATVTELAHTLGAPKGTVGHHVGVLLDAGLIRLVRTKKVRAIEAKYYGRTARTYLLKSPAEGDFELAPDYFLSSAASEYALASTRRPDGDETPMMSTLRHARIPDDRAGEWLIRLGELAQEFVSEERAGETTFGLLVAFYPTDRPHLPADGGEA